MKKKDYTILLTGLVILLIVSGIQADNVITPSKDSFNSSIGINSIYTFPLGNYDKDINSGPGFGIESNIMVKDNVSVHLYLNYLGLDGDEIFSRGFDNVMDQRYDPVTVTQYSNYEFVAALQFNRRLYKFFRKIYLNAGAGILMENYKDVTTIYDNNEFVRELEYKYSNAYSLLHIGAGLEQNLSKPIGINYAFAFDRINKSNSEFKFKLNLYLGFVYRL